MRSLWFPVSGGVLRGACDGEGLLDNHMNVAQESECLKHLILTDVSLKGRSFQHLLADAQFASRCSAGFGFDLYRLLLIGL